MTGLGRSVGGRAGALAYGRLVLSGQFDPNSGVPTAAEDGQIWKATAGATLGGATIPSGALCLFSEGKTVVHILPQSSSAGGGGSSLSATAWNLAADSALPAGAGIGSMYQITGANAIRDGQRCVDGDIVIVNRDATTISNLTNKGKSTSSASYVTLDPTNVLGGVLSGGNLIFTGTLAAAVGGANLAMAQTQGTATKVQAEFTLGTLDSGYFSIGVLEGDPSGFSTSNGLFVVYVTGLGWVLYVLTAGEAAVPTPFGGPTVPAPGDVYILGLDKTTRKLVLKQNGTLHTLPDIAAPGSGTLRFTTGRNAADSGDIVVTTNFGPTITGGHATYVGVYDTTYSYEGGFRVVSRDWNPADGYPAFELPGDVHFSNADATVPADGESFFKGEAVYWDGGAARHWSDSPVNFGAMSWAGDLELDVGNDTDAAAMPAITELMEGNVYRVLQHAYVSLTAATYLDMSKIFPRGSTVMVRNGEWQLLTYDFAAYTPALTTVQALTQNVTVGTESDPGTVATLIPGTHPLSGNGTLGNAIVNGVQFEHPIQDLGSVSTSTKVGIWLPFLADGTTPVAYSDCDTPTVQGQLFFFFDFADKALKLTWHNGTIAQELVVADLSAETFAIGDVLGFTVLRGSLISSGQISFHVNGRHKGTCNAGTDASVTMTNYPWGFAAFTYNPTGTNADRVFFDSNSGARPFRYAMEAADYNYKWGYTVPLLPDTVATINGIGPDASGNVALPNGAITHLVREQPHQALGDIGHYALDIERGRLYGPKVVGGGVEPYTGWGTQDDLPYWVNVNSSTLSDLHTAHVPVNNPGVIGHTGIQADSTTGKRQIGCKLSGSIHFSSAARLAVGYGSVGALTNIIELKRTSGSAWVVYNGTDNYVSSPGSFVEGEEWNTIWNFTDNTITVAGPNGSSLTLSGGVAFNALNQVLKPTGWGNGTGGSVTITLQPDGNSLTPADYDGKGWQQTPLTNYRSVFNGLEVLSAKVDALNTIVVTSLADMPDPTTVANGQKLQVRLTGRTLDFVKHTNAGNPHWGPVGGRAVLSAAGSATSSTGTTAIQHKASLVVPGGLLSEAGGLLVKGYFTFTNNANDKALEVSFGGTVFWASPTNVSLAGVAFEVMITNLNNPAAQLSFGKTGAAESTPVSGSVDTTVDQTLNISVTMEDAGDTSGLAFYSVEMID